MFIPVFKIGAAFGRIAGEALHLYFPLGIRYGGHISQIIPGKNDSLFALFDTNDIDFSNIFRWIRSGRGRQHFPEL